MTRPLRLEYAGAVYHVTSRGDRRAVIYRDRKDREAWLEVLETTCRRYNFILHAYCQMNNHYHLMVETIEGNLSQGMRLLNGAYSQHFNRRHGYVGHVFQGRYKAILIQKESHLLELTRYVALNPVRAGILASPDDWPWSSHYHLVGDREVPVWIETDWLLAQFGKHRSAALQAYRQFVLDGIGVESPLTNISHQLILGDDAFVAMHQAESEGELLRDLSRTHRRLQVMPLSAYQEKYANRDQAMAMAYHSTAFTMAEIGLHFGVSDRTVRRAVKVHESLNDDLV